VPASPARPAWLRQHVARLVVLDAVAVVAASAVAKLWSFGLESADLPVRGMTIPYNALIVAIVPTWLAVLAVTGCYDIGPFGTGATEYRRVVRAGADFLAVVAVAYFVLHLENLARGFLVAMVPLAVAFTLGLRAGAQWHLGLRRRRGRAVRRAVVVGSRRSVEGMVRHLDEHRRSGLEAVAACAPGPADPIGAGGHRIPVLGGTDAVIDVLRRSGADTVVFTGSLARGGVRALAWKLEGSGIDVFVMPALTRREAVVDVRPVAGLPLLYVDRGTPEPRPAASAPPVPLPSGPPARTLGPAASVPAAAGEGDEPRTA
jgi:FlaA1/EpsC-like NDP-sugar epimerase